MPKQIVDARHAEAVHAPVTHSEPHTLIFMNINSKRYNLPALVIKVSNTKKEIPSGHLGQD